MEIIRMICIVACWVLLFGLLFGLFVAFVLDIYDRYRYEICEIVGKVKRWFDYSLLLFLWTGLDVFLFIYLIVVFCKERC